MSEHSDSGAEGTPAPGPLPDSGWLLRLQALIRDAAAGGPSVTEFCERLLAQGARLIAQTSRSGRVSGVSYDYEGHLVKGSVLGPAYTWSGVQKKLGVTYVRQRDQAALEGKLEAPARDETDGGAGPQAPLPLDLSAGTAPTPPPSEADDAVGAPDAAGAPAETGRPADDAPRAVESWAAWAAALEQEGAEGHMAPQAGTEGQTATADADAAVPAPPSQAGIQPEPSAQWQALVGAMEELRDQIRALEARIGEARPAPASAAEPSPAGGLFGGLQESEQIAEMTAAARQARQAAQQATDAVTRAKQESLWLSVTSAAIAGLVAALVVGLWVSQTVSQQAQEARQAIIEHLDKQAAEDPLRQYFERIVKKLQ